MCIMVTSTPSMSDNSGKLKSWNSLCELETVWLVMKSPLFSNCLLLLTTLEESYETYYFLNLLNPVNIMGFWVLRTSPSSRSKFQLRGDNNIHSTYSPGSCILFISSSMVFLEHWKGSCRCLIFSLSFIANDWDTMEAAIATQGLDQIWTSIVTIVHLCRDMVLKQMEAMMTDSNTKCLEGSFIGASLSM